MAGGTRVGFIGWNTFQFLHYRSLVEKIPSAVCIVEPPRSIRAALVGLATERLLGREVVRLGRHAPPVDSLADVLVCQTPFPGLEEVRETPVVMLQYGYAKEWHNFGAWRCMGDLCLTFGPHASAGIGGFCECLETGNHRYDSWHDPEFQSQARAKHRTAGAGAKPVVLFAPTWGASKTTHHFAAALASQSAFDVIYKPHHNTMAGFGRAPGKNRTASFTVKHPDDDIVELLAASDLLVTDGSGAIFDAIYCAKPVVLMGCEPESPAAAQSIEWRRRAEIAPSVDDPARLCAVISAELSAARESTQDHPLRSLLFKESGRSADAMAEAILAFAGRKKTTTPEQIAAREAWVRTRLARETKWQRKLKSAAIRTVADFLKKPHG